ncbi:MAG: hypothetical protein UIB63_01485 [Methanobrevibacter sp.]|nr:hypothetical protein [Methanobrevibacter sp.]
MSVITNLNYYRNYLVACILPSRNTGLKDHAFTCKHESRSILVGVCVEDGK